MLPYVGTSSIFGVNVVRSFSLNLAGSYVTGLEGVEIAGGANVESGFACGVQMARSANVVAGPVSGWQLAGGANGGGALDGAQTAGALNLASDVRGIQLGAIDIATGGVVGAQVGAVNVAAGDVEGAQVGAVNVAAGGVEGVQIGAINVARRSTFSLGAITLVPEGRTHLDLWWGMESGLVMAGLKHGGGHFHNIYGFGIRPGSTDGDGFQWAIVLGFGGHFPVSSRIFVDADLLVNSLFTSESPSATRCCRSYARSWA